MNNTFSLEQISKTEKLDAISLQYKLDLMPRFMEIKSINPKLTQKQIAKVLAFSDSSSKRYRIDTKMQSLYKLPQTNHKRGRLLSNDTENLE